MTHKKKMTIGLKLWLLSIGLLFNLLVVGGLSMWTTHKLSHALVEATGTLMPSVRYTGLIDMMHDGIRANVFNAIIVSGSENAEEIAAVKAEGIEFQENIKNYIKNLSELNLDPQIRSAIGPILPELEKYEKKSNEISTLAHSGEVEEAIKALPEFQRQFDLLATELETLGSRVMEKAETATKIDQEMANLSTILNVSAVSGGLLLGIFFSWLLIRSLQRTLTKTVEDLTKESYTVTQSAHDLSQTAQRLSDSTSQQASALQETVASVEEINAMVKITGDNAKTLEVAAKQSHGAAGRGQEAIKKMLSSMRSISDANAKIRTQVEDGNRKITEIVKVISEIGDKTKVINDIVFQTKLLSFNASVEAARAGEHGKGFAVVAEEVGNLAQMSGTAAKEISGMLSSGIKKVEGIVSENKSFVESLVSEGKEEISSGVKVAQQCGDALQEIVRHSEDVNKMISEITTAIHEQNQGVNEITKAIQLLDQETQVNISSSQNTSMTSDKLRNQAETLAGIINTLERMVRSDTENSSQPHGNSTISENALSQDTAGDQKVIFLNKHGKKSKIPVKNEEIRMAVGSQLVPSAKHEGFEDF